jgi:hypothetical protein
VSYLFAAAFLPQQLEYEMMGKKSVFIISQYDART